MFAIVHGACLALLIAVSTAAHAAGTATVRGADGVNVRQQPDADSPSIVVLRRGRVVTVERLIGPWALIRLDSGRRGYIKATYLDLPAGLAVEAVATASPPVTAAATPIAQSTQTHTAGPTNTPATEADAPPRAGLEREVAQLRDRLAALESALVATPADSMAQAGGGGSEAAVDREPTRGHETARAAGALPPGADAPLEPDELGASLALAGVGVVVGFLLGAAYGRRQERTRRSRVRF
jgi:hypothetical protein